MAFSDDQKAALAAPLNRGNVKQREQAGRKLSYIEGWRAIAEANRIFGFDGWHRETVELREIGEARQVDGKWRVAYMSRVRVRVTSSEGYEILRDGCGYGSGIDKDVGSAHESALKEAETDAMKRAFMTFGNPFGLALYDKEQLNVVDAPQEPPPVDPAQIEYIRSCWTKISSLVGTEAELRHWWTSQSAARRSFDLDQALVDEMKAAVMKRLDTFKVAA